MPFLDLVNRKGASAIYHKDASLTPCPCRTREGFRDPEWHLEHPLEPECNENGFLADPSQTTTLTVKAFVQPARSGKVASYMINVFDEFRTDDHLGIFPVVWQGIPLDFENFDKNGDDYIEYDNKRFIVVGAIKIPDPADNDVPHHYEIALRLTESV